MVAKCPCALSTNVSKPENQGRGRQQITDYLITTSFDSKLSTAESLVRRTFADFQWIQKRLVQERMGIIVPVVPSNKSTSNKDLFSELFIKARAESLDKFLQRVIHHPELVDAPILYSFFTNNPSEWKATKDGIENDKDLLLKENTRTDPEDELAHLDTIQIDAQAALNNSTGSRKTGPMRRWLANKREQWALQNKNLMLEENPEEAKKFADMQTYADHLEVCAKIVNQDFKQIVSSSTKISNNMQNIGASFAQLWGEHDLSNTSSSNLYQKLGEVWASVSKRISNHVCFEESYVDSRIDDLVNDIIALQNALSKRKVSLYAYTKLKQQGRDLTRQLDKIKKSNNIETQQDRYFKLEQDLRHCDLEIETNRNHCELVTSRLEKDVERFRVEWHERMRCVLEVFHKEHIAFLQSQAKDFSTLLTPLAAVDSERSNLPTGSIPQNSVVDVSYASGVAKATIIDHGHAGNNETHLPDFAVGAPPRLQESEQVIQWNESFSSDDGFGAISTMGGDTNQVASTNKPIMKSV